MRAAVVIVCCGLVLLSGTHPARGDPAAIPVVASFTVLGDLVSELGGDRVSVKSLVGPDSDAHVYEPTPADARAVASAHVIVLNGLGFEGWILRLLDSAQSRAVIVTASKGVTVREANGHADPHAWQDPGNARIYVTNIAAALVAAMPEDAAQIETREKLYLKKLRDLDATLRQQFATIPTTRRRVITSHDAFAYFGAAYGIEFLPAQGWTTESEPSAANIARLVVQAKSQQVSAVFLENISDPRMMRQLALDTGLSIGGRLHSDALGPPGDPAGTYLGMISSNAQLLLATLRTNIVSGSKPQ
jgi:zinc/manganese transport system substrate-binding protein